MQNVRLDEAQAGVKIARRNINSLRFADVVPWHHQHQQFSGHEFEETLGVGDGQGGLVLCSPWGHKESDMI